EDGIRDRNVTGVQTCALPISRLYVANRRPKPIVKTLGSRTLRAASTTSSLSPRRRHCRLTRRRTNARSRFFRALCVSHSSPGSRSEERRVGKGGRWGGWGGCG